MTFRVRLFDSVNGDEGAQVGVGDANRMAEPVDQKLVIIDQSMHGSGRKPQNLGNLLDGVKLELARRRLA